MFNLLEYGLCQMYRNLGVFGNAYDVTESEEKFIFKMGIPGVQQKDLDIRIRDGKRLTIKYTKESKFTQPFYYAFVLPCKIVESETSACVKDGILTLTLIKAEPDEYKVKLQENEPQ